MTFVNRLIKRAFDLLVSIVGCCVLLIPGVMIALLVVSTSRGPALFLQRRIGRHGRSFTCIKFRTMALHTDTNTVTQAGDRRITPLGRFLRKTKLDELPQLYSVLIGTMSFVGPRPDVPGYADALAGDDREILSLRPGITGPASIFFRSEEELLAQAENPRQFNDTVLWPVKVAINRIYLQEWSFLKDIAYILITIVPGLDARFGLMRRFIHFRDSLTSHHPAGMIH